MSDPINVLVDKLPTGGLTVSALRLLDFAIPGEWQNLTGFDHTIQAVTGEKDATRLRRIRERAIALYSDPTQGYQRAIRIYQTAQMGGTALGTAALAGKVGEKISLLSFLDKLTPKADVTQAIDFCVKLVAEGMAYGQLHGLPLLDFNQFNVVLSRYHHEALMRITALIAFDALVPFGPDFLDRIQTLINNLTQSDLQQNQTFKQVGEVIPGNDSNSKLNFVTNSFNAAKEWIQQFTTSHGLTSDRVLGNLRSVVDFSDDKLDYLAAFTDVTVGYFSHTGIQTVARRVIEQASQSIQTEDAASQSPVAVAAPPVIVPQPQPPAAETRPIALPVDQQQMSQPQVSSLSGRIALKTRKGQYIGVQRGERDGIVAKREAIGAGETFELINLGDGKVALKANNGNYVNTEQDQDVAATVQSIGASATFELIEVGDRQVALKANNGQYLCAEKGGGQTVVANRSEIGPWETFEMINV